MNLNLEVFILFERKGKQDSITNSHKYDIDGGN